jgi:ATP-dependent DNA helicase DinG
MSADDTVTDDRLREALARVTARLPAGGEDRPGQVEMAVAVGGAIRTERHLAVQAGTGTGKSLGYLVPAALSGRKVVVATATKALQDQLAERDLPLVGEALGHSFTWAVLKGRNNYLCRQRARELGDNGFQAELDGAEPESVTDSESGEDPSGEDQPADSGGGAMGLADQVRWLVRWGKSATSGDRSDLPFEPRPRAWSTVSVGPRECPGAFRCPSGPHCFAESARDHAAAADVLVVNLHLYGAHVASGGQVLPPHDVVVFDEAHQLEDVMTATLGVEIAPGRLRALGSAARTLLPASGQREADDLVDSAQRLSALLGERVGTRVDDAEDVRSLVELLSGRVRGLIERLRRSGDTDHLWRSDGPGGLGSSGAPSHGDDGRRQRAMSAATHLADDLQRIVEGPRSDVRWVDGNRRAPVLRASPIDVGTPLAPLWQEVTAVLTSATIPPRLRERVGLPGEQSEEIDVGSPFDYRAHALLYVARHLPDRRRPEAEPAIHRELAELIAAAGGRTLALFTSHRAMEAAAGALREQLDVRVWLQGDLPKGRLLQAFAEDETSCLFATMGFWQGIDVPGPSLSLVTVDRIPFPRPDDPVLQARRDAAGPAAFGLIDLPRAATLLAQGAGRLIRSREDSGVVAVLDPRLATAGYRRVLLARVPPMRRTTDPRQVADFLWRVLGSPAGRGADSPAGARRP